MKIEFGSKLKKIRMERGMSQEEFATLLGTSKQVISRYETNQRIPKITVAQEYAKKLEVPLNFLIDNNIFSSSELSETEQKIISVENDLKNLILSRYKSIREFCFAIDIPYSTIDSILKRGIENAGSGKIIKICKHLKISADELAIGNIVPIDSLTQYSKNDLSSREQTVIKKFRELDDQGKYFIETMLDAHLEMKFRTNSKSNDKIS